jgi:hypothetical protein
MFCIIEGTCLISIFVGLSTYNEGQSRVSYTKYYEVASGAELAYGCRCIVLECRSLYLSLCLESAKSSVITNVVKGNFGISDTEYISTASPIGSEPIISHLIYSNVREDLLQQHYTFDILWNTAIPAERRIREIEEGIERVETIAL